MTQALENTSHIVQITKKRISVFSYSKKNSF